MFEKCGLRDIFCKIAKRKWVMLLIIVIFACIGAGLYAKDLSEQKNKAATVDEGERKAFVGHAYYYVSVEDGSSSNARVRQIARNYISLMKLPARSEAIYDSLLKDRSEKELADLLGAYKFEEGIGASELWGNAYKVAYLNKGYILRVTTFAETKTMSKEVMKACRKQLEKLAKELPDSELTFEGVDYVHKTMTDTDKKGGMSGYRLLLMWLAIGIILALLYAIISAVLRPVINRPQDFEMYDVHPAGLAAAGSAGMAARLLEAKTAGKTGKIVLATSRKNDKKIKEFTELLNSEWKKIYENAAADEDPGREGPVIELAEDPGGSAEASDLCSAAETVFTIERKGETTHRAYDEMVHYLEQIGKMPEEAILIR